MPQQLTLTEADQGAIHPLGVGQQVSVQLEETPTTGYRWSMDVEPATAVESLSDAWEASSGNEPGGSGKRVFLLRAVMPGQVRLHLRLWRPWQGEGSVERRCELQLQAEPR